MSVSLHDYQMSPHDLSTIVRNTQSPGTLVPNLCIVGQKGDTFDIDIDANVLTHPTVGPLFGSFKLEHHIYTAPVRLYNSWLHNNRTKIGLNMAQVKLPQITVALKQTNDNPSNNDNQWTQVNPSCLLAYLGIRGYGALNTATKTASKNALPILAYYDIFKKLLRKHSRRKLLHYRRITNIKSINKRHKYNRSRHHNEQPRSSYLGRNSKHRTNNDSTRPIS